MNNDMILGEDSIPVQLVSRTESVDVKAQLGRVMSMLGRHAAVIVTRDGEYRGLVDSRSFYNTKAPLLLQKGQTVEKFAARPPLVDRRTKIDDVMLAFYRSKAKALPYAENGKVTGIIDRNTLLKVLLSLKMVEGTVGDAMTSPAIAISDESGLSQAKTAMENNRVRRLLVVHDGRFAGLLTYFTIIKNYAVRAEGLPEMKSREYSPGNVAISGIIERNPRTVGSDRDLVQAVRSMVEGDISALVVTKGRDVPVGMLTATDVLESVISRRRIDVNRIFVSGFEGADLEYEPEIREELKDLVTRLKGSRVAVEYLLMHVKKIRSNRYDIRLRVSTKEFGIISAHITDFLLDRTFKEAVDVLRRDIMKEKEKMLGARKDNERWKLIK